MSVDSKTTDTIEQTIEYILDRLETLTSGMALAHLENGMPQKAQALIEDIHGPMCALCGERCRRSHRTDRNVHRRCWEEEKTDG